MSLGELIQITYVKEQSLLVSAISIILTLNLKVLRPQTMKNKNNDDNDSHHRS